MDWETTDPDTPTLVRKAPKGGGGSNWSGTPVPPAGYIDIHGNRQPKPEKKHGCFFKFVVTIIAINVAVFVIRGVNTWNYEHESFEWPTTGIAMLLPHPESNRGVINSNTDGYFQAELRKASAVDYSDYVAACKDKGFSLDGSSNSYGYTAYNSDGYKLSVTFASSNNKLSISLTAPIKMQEIVWPTTDLGALVPAPESTKGVITTDSSTRFEATVGDTDEAAFNAYIDTCVAAGYSVDYARTNDRYENSYSAQNADGVRLKISYEGGNIVEIEVGAPYKNNAETESTETEPAETEPADEDASDGTPDDVAGGGEG